MFSMFKSRPSILLEAENAKFKPKFIFQFLIFLAVFIISQIAAAIPMIIATFVKVFSDMTNGVFQRYDTFDYLSTTEVDMTLVLLFSTAIATIITVIYCRFIEKRSLYSMGFVKNGAVSEYSKGLLIGFLMLSACVLISVLTGTLLFDGVTLGNSMGLLFIFLIGFVFQGMSEEVIFRGYFMISVATRKPLLFAVLANSVLFAVMHSLNNGISILGLINLTLFGIFASFYTLKTNSIWGTCAIHSVWNFSQGNIFGISVSGKELQASVFSFVPTETGTIINGGSFGLEGGLAVTIVMIVSIIASLQVKRLTLMKQDDRSLAS